ncbi:hypothetical protein EIK77_002917 [Talaromyces pinophilus]|nr:hypothetical protein EIK77_002917 [Talaromyces pinophilus]
MDIIQTDAESLYEYPRKRWVYACIAVTSTHVSYLNSSYDRSVKSALALETQGYQNGRTTKITHIHRVHRLPPEAILLIYDYVEWSDSSNSTPLSRLDPFIDYSNSDDPTTLLTFYSTLSPSISESDTLTTNPITELVTVAVPSDISPDNHKQFNNDQLAFRDALLNKAMPESVRPITWARGQIERPAEFEHQDSPSGKALVYLNVIGWKSREQHTQARDTKAFAETIEPIRKRVLMPVKGMDMKHVKFQKIGF